MGTKKFSFSAVSFGFHRGALGRPGPSDWALKSPEKPQEAPVFVIRVAVGGAVKSGFLSELPAPSHFPLPRSPIVLYPRTGFQLNNPPVALNENTRAPHRNINVQGVLSYTKLGTELN